MAQDANPPDFSTFNSMAQQIMTFLPHLQTFVDQHPELAGQRSSVTRDDTLAPGQHRRTPLAVGVSQEESEYMGLPPSTQQRTLVNSQSTPSDGFQHDDDHLEPPPPQLRNSNVSRRPVNSGMSAQPNREFEPPPSQPFASHSRPRDSAQPLRSSRFFNQSQPDEHFEPPPPSQPRGSSNNHSSGLFDQSEQPDEQLEPPPSTQPRASRNARPSGIFSQSLQPDERFESPPPSQYRAFRHNQLSGPFNRNSQPDNYLGPPPPSQLAPSTLRSSRNVPSAASHNSPPPITPFTSINMLNSITRSSSSSGHPRLTTHPGFASLIQHANRTRMEHAQASLPRNRKPRGKAKRAPTLFTQLSGPRLEDCIQMDGGEAVAVNLKIKVFPPYPSQADRRELNIPNNIFRYWFNENSFEAVLSSLHLIHYIQHLSISTTISDLFAELKHTLVELGYRFGSSASLPPFLGEERYPFTLLGYLNAGRCNGDNKAPKLVAKTHMPDETLESLLRNSREFGIARWAVSRDNYFELNVIMRASYVELDANLHELQLGPSNEVRAHRCLGKRIYAIFRSDIDALDSEGMQELFGEECDRLLERTCQQQEEEETEEHVVARTLTRGSGLRSLSARGRLTTVASASTSRSVSSSSTSSASSLMSTSSSELLPSFPSGPSRAFEPTMNEPASFSFSEKVWEDADWKSPQAKRSPQPVDAWYEFQRPRAIFDAVGDRYRDTNDDDVPNLHLKATSVAGLASQLEDEIVAALRDQDFTVVLSPNRHFTIIDEEDEFVTSGPGTEFEVVQYFVKKHLDNQGDGLLVQRVDQYSTLATVPIHAARWITEQKKQALGILGTAAALSLVYGMGAEPINPLLLVYLINGGDLRCLTPGLMAKWFPQVHQTIQDWISAGPEGDTSRFQGHFATYHDMTIGSISSRSQAMHNALGWEMLQNTIVGPHRSSHPYFQAFLAGFLVPMRNGFTLPDYAHSFTYGAEKFVTDAFSSSIKGYSSLRISYDTSALKDDTLERVNELLIGDNSLSATSLPALFQRFLEGTGAPCPSELEAIKHRFSKMINLGELDEPSFRSKIFSWAATGVTYVLQSGEETTVHFVENDNAEYIGGILARHVHGYVSSGVCKFQTCPRKMFIPVSFIIKLLEQAYDENSVFPNARLAIDHWLLASSLDGIEQHNII
ncbi:hypothetical protein VNI00_000707 [Paramarasmius palmivorus]|uniref:Uncharacterized protein n=1 Tax=Paramarasmius palmivorus TaxID=297713 RepID=A0AAW0E9T0_9AGAR